MNPFDGSYKFSWCVDQMNCELDTFRVVLGISPTARDTSAHGDRWSMGQAGTNRREPTLSSIRFYAEQPDRWHEFDPSFHTYRQVRSWSDNDSDSDSSVSGSGSGSGSGSVSGSSGTRVGTPSSSQDDLLKYMDPFGSSSSNFGYQPGNTNTLGGYSLGLGNLPMDFSTATGSCGALPRQVEAPATAISFVKVLETIQHALSMIVTIRTFNSYAQYAGRHQPTWGPPRLSQVTHDFKCLLQAFSRRMRGTFEVSQGHTGNCEDLDAYMPNTAETKNFYVSPDLQSNLMPLLQFFSPRLDEIESLDQSVDEIRSMGVPGGRVGAEALQTVYGALTEPQLRVCAALQLIRPPTDSGSSSGSASHGGNTQMAF